MADAAGARRKKAFTVRQVFTGKAHFMTYVVMALSLATFVLMYFATF